MKKLFYSIIVVAALVVCYTSNAMTSAKQEVDAVTSATQIESTSSAKQKAKKSSTTTKKTKKSSTTKQKSTTLTQWKAGEQVSLADVKKYGVEKCFVAEDISDAIFARMWKKSFKESCTLPRTELRYIKALHYTLDGKIQLGEMVCNKAIAQDLIEIFRKLYDAKYPIERMVLVDNYDALDEPSMEANNSSCFNFRFITGTTKLSNHSKGRAVDINTLYNPYVKERKDGSVYVKPSTGKPYIDRTKTFDYKIDHNDLCYKLFIEHGFEWGGDWHSVKDYQHFEKSE